MDKNLHTYNSQSVVSWYSQLNKITAVEKKIFQKYHGFIINSNILDIGIGGGRTTNYLINNCKKYTGIDYSKNFINSVKNVYPNASLEVMDARSLKFNDASHDFVNFSFNGIDYVNLEGREQIFSEISRILKPGGLFFFSTHNKEHSSFNKKPWLNKTESLFTNLKTLIKLLPFLIRKIKNKKYELINEDYAVINDSAHNYSLMTFYSTPSFLRTQLQAAHFSDITFYDKEGLVTEDKKSDAWIFVTCKKVRI